MLNGKLDTIIDVMLFDLANTVNQVVTIRVISLTGCRGWKMPELSG